MQKVAKITLGSLSALFSFLAYGGVGAIETGGMGLWYMIPVFVYVACAAITGKVALSIGRSKKRKYDGCKAVQKCHWWRGPSLTEKHCEHLLLTGKRRERRDNGACLSFVPKKEIYKPTCITLKKGKK